ncbi:hypothetical protein FAZ69_24825 [Trinickia terrae]|uniref:Rap1a immunity protein domain-containing protein n=1 Tax=Trinickia terrae TaxID=2571161 RepID=A0A4U1HNS3_9BURK|nr:hypothetical protein [Trinickia terrae]TKC82931.1 hypothetical protein FAZ69_24825 [Trinickia terrae]
MKRNVITQARRTANALFAAAALATVSQAYAQQPVADQPHADPSFSAYSLSQLCQQKTDNVAQGQCVGAVRGIIHGYQYGVLFLGQRATVPPNAVQQVSLCLAGTPVAAIVDEFVADTHTVNDDALKRTPAEVAVLGSVHMHHACN